MQYTVLAYYSQNQFHSVGPFTAKSYTEALQNAQLELVKLHPNTHYSSIVLKRHQTTLKVA